MDNRPIIGITTQTLDAIPDQLPRCWVMSQRYVQMLVTVGAVPWVIPLLEGDEATLRGIYEQIDGLFLPGGVDVDPSAYGEARGPHCQRDRKSTRLNSSHTVISYAVFCLKKKKTQNQHRAAIGRRIQVFRADHGHLRR